MSAFAKTDALMARGRAFLGSEHAILCGAMSWVSERNLVAAISNGGGFGVIACGAMTPELLDGEIAATKALTSKPFGVNLITMHPMLFDLIGVCEKHGVSHVVLAGAATNWCIRATAYGALERGYDLTLIKDAHTTGTMEFEDGTTIAAADIVRDLNIGMTWVSYPGRTNSTATAAEVDFAVAGNR